jgi:predicted small secreted protein
LRIRRAASIHSRVKTILILASLSAIAIFSSACNTTIGLGRDLRLLGEGMESSAQKTKGADDHSGAPVY